MAGKTIRCPKCGHEQNSQPECEACGLIFSRYKKVEERRQERLARRAEIDRHRKRRWGSVGRSLLLMLATAAATWYYLDDSRQHDSVGTPHTAIVPVTTAATTTPVPAPPPVSIVEKPIPPPRGDGSDQGRASTIEEARQATVSIETPWGSGSGFFVSENFIVTNRHVVQVDEKVVAEYRHKVETTRRLVELERQKIQDLRARYRASRSEPTRRQLEIIIAENERNLARIVPRLEEAELQLASFAEKLRPDDIAIVLADGSRHAVNFFLLSDGHDLALLSLYINDIGYLSPPPAGTRLQQGDRVYTIGSPAGLRNTVTAGVFSGYRKDPENGHLFLQTDAPINPGNSGGPLIDEKGYVQGVNTMILRDTQGIGFAIPIATVFEEFGSSLY
ncbi:MAG: trypsin-like peptidase domain-containing protein [Desulfopila sp.]